MLVGRNLRVSAFATLAVALLAGTAHAKLFTDPSQLPANKRYDYIVVGASPGGSVIARRLSENPSTNVLVIEAGPSDQDVLAIQVPSLASQLQPNTVFDYNYTTVPQDNLDSRVIQYPRGRVLGGSSTINFMVYNRGSQDDYNKYASITGDNGWSWNALQPYFKKLEQLVAPADNHDTTGDVLPNIHGTSGPLQISLAGAPFPADDRIIETTQQLSSEFPFNVDMNSGNPLGVGWMQATIGGGARCSASTAYIQPVLSRSNLDVLINTSVTKLIHIGTWQGKPIFNGVQFAQSSTSPKFALNATKEVVLAAGAINTPQLLMLSGLGPHSALSKLGIKAVLDLPDVGQHLADHPLLPNQFTVASSEDDIIDNLVRNATFANELVGEWIANRQGVMVNAAGNHVAWVRIPKDDDIWNSVQDPSAGPTTPHFEFLFVPGFVSYAEAMPSTGFFMTFFTMVVTPTSRGSVTLASSDPFTSPVIDPNFLDSDFDVYAMRTAVRSMARFASAPAWDGFLTGQGSSFADVDVDNDDAVDAWARSQVSTIWHPASTARMGKCSDGIGQGSVVNPDFTVKGVKGLRIVDASVLPFIPAAHPMGAVYVFAERAADLIKSGKSSC